MNYLFIIIKPIKTHSNDYFIIINFKFFQIIIKINKANIYN